MMVGHDEIEANPLRFFGCSEGTYSGVDTHHEAHALSRRGFDPSVLHAIAFANAVRNVVSHIGHDPHCHRCTLERRLQENGRDGAIGVVIAVD
jgi:hypothetical protein